MKAITSWQEIHIESLRGSDAIANHISIATDHEVRYTVLASLLLVHGASPAASR